MTDWGNPERMRRIADETVIERIDAERRLAQQAVDRERFALAALTTRRDEAVKRAVEQRRTEKHIRNVRAEHSGDVAWAREDLRRAIKHQVFVEARYREALARV